VRFRGINEASKNRVSRMAMKLKRRMGDRLGEEESRTKQNKRERSTLFP